MSIRSTRLSAMGVFAAASSAVAANELPTRTNPIPETTNGVPHVQIGVEPVPEISEALLDKVAAIPLPRPRHSSTRYPGTSRRQTRTRGSWLWCMTPLRRESLVIDDGAQFHRPERRVRTRHL